MKRLAVLAAAVLFPTLSFAVEMGIGASARDDEATVYLPIDVSPRLRIEPFFSYYAEENTQATSSLEFERLELGVGGFGRMELHERIAPYFGGRLAYVDQEVTSTTPASSTSSNLDGFRIEPTIGAEFYMIPRVSVALEAFLYFEDLDGNNGAIAVTDEESGNGTRLLLRIML